MKQNSEIEIEIDFIWQIYSFISQKEMWTSQVETTFLDKKIFSTFIRNSILWKNLLKKWKIPNKNFGSKMSQKVVSTWDVHKSLVSQRYTMSEIPKETHIFPRYLKVSHGNSWDT